MDAIFLYRNIALDRGFPYVELPDSVNLSDVSQTESYARVRFTTDHGQTFRGGPIRFSATILANAANPAQAAELITFLVSPGGQELVKDYHFLPGDIVLGGDVASAPAQILPFLSRSGRS